jgi:hypothetical protein
MPGRQGARAQCAGHRGAARRHPRGWLGVGVSGGGAAAAAAAAALLPVRSPFHFLVAACPSAANSPASSRADFACRSAPWVCCVCRCVLCTNVAM